MGISPAATLWKLISAGSYACLAILVVATLGCGIQRDPSFEQGQEIYKAYCLTCHGPKGQGVLYSKTVLNGDAFVQGNPDEVVNVILYGREGSGRMPGWETKLSDQEVAAVATFIRQAWSNQASAVTTSMVAKVRTREGQKSP